MIWFASKAICETIGSIMNQQVGKYRNLEPEDFIIKMVLKVNIWPLHHLDSLIDEVFASYSGR